MMLVALFRGVGSVGGGGVCCGWRGGDDDDAGVKRGCENSCFHL